MDKNKIANTEYVLAKYIKSSNHAEQGIKAKVLGIPSAPHTMGSNLITAKTLKVAVMDEEGYIVKIGTSVTQSPVINRKRVFTPPSDEPYQKYPLRRRMKWEWLKTPILASTVMGSTLIIRGALQRFPARVFNGLARRAKI